MKTLETAQHPEAVGLEPRATLRAGSQRSGKTFTWLRLGVVGAMAMTLAGALSAEPITFTFSGICNVSTESGTLVDLAFTLTLSTDTTLIQSSSSAFFTLPVADAGINIQLLGSGTFTEAWQVLNDPSNNLVEFTDSIHGVVLGGTNPTLTSYNLQSAIGPVFLSGPTTFGLFNSIPTSLGNVTISTVSSVTFSAFTGGGVWTQVQPPSLPSFTASPFIGTCLLLTDGTVPCRQDQTSAWFRLAPDAFGNYATGTWSLMPSMPTCNPGDCVGPYAPTYFASAVLADGTLYVVGGEDNGNYLGANTNMGAIYDPVRNTWTALASPFPSGKVGDEQSVVLDDGTFMTTKHNYGMTPVTEAAFLPPGCHTTTACFNIDPTMPGKADANDEEGWTLLPGGNVLVVNVNSSIPGSQIYTPGTNPPTTGLWTNAGNTGTLTVVDIPDHEIGPQVLRPDGTVIVFGGSGQNAVYDTKTGTWANAPSFPVINGQQLDVADGPAALLPNGNVLVGASPGYYSYQQHTYFYEWDGASLIQVQAPPDGAIETTTNNRMLVLPTGQILFTDGSGSGDVEVYTESLSTTYMDAWRPTIITFPGVILPTGTYPISGTQFNGLSQGAMYGDDAQMATNYPLVRLTDGTGHVFYGRTHNHSTMAVATGSAVVSTNFDVLPANLPVGTYCLEVVANGIPSLPACGVQVLSLVPLTQISTTASGLAYSRVTQTFNGTVTIKNTSSSTIAGPFQIFFEALTATLTNAVGSFGGGPVLTVPAVSLAPGQSVTVPVQFKNPSNAVITFTPVIYSASIN